MAGATLARIDLDPSPATCYRQLGQEWLQQEPVDLCMRGKRPMTTIETLADFIASFPARDIPPTTRAMAEDCILDATGAAAAGFGTGGAQAVRAVGGSLFGPGPATLWFADTDVSPTAAAFANGMAASALDIDDGHRVAVGHPGASIIPAAIATAEVTGAGGDDVLAAIVLGYEAAVRLSAARNMETHLSIATGRWGAFGAAAAAGRLRGLAPDRLAQALLIAENHAPGLLAAHLHGFGGAHVKEGIAWSVVAGLTALELAQSGFTGYPNTLDLPELYDGSQIGADLGTAFWIDRTYFKLYSCCRAIHPAVDALVALIAEHRLSATDITSVRVDGCALTVNLNNKVDPPNFEASQFSVPFALAVAAIDGADALLPLAPDLLGRRDLVEFGKRVTLALDPAIEALFPGQMAGRVIVEAKGDTFERYVPHALGDPDNPLGREGIRSKFRRLTAPVLAQERQETMIASGATFGADGLARLLDALRPALGVTAPRI
jgi:2-methylcitrate dehydratase PrpD